MEVTMSKKKARNNYSVIIASSLIILIFCFSDSEATLPSISASEMADLLETYQKNINRAQFKYTITHGSFKDDDISKGIFIPKFPAWTIETESGVDFVTGVEYIREDMFSNGKHYIRESAFDGKIGTQFNSSAPGSDQWKGLIRQGPPTKLQVDKPKDWRPREVSYWPIDGCALSEIIRKSKNIKIESDEIAGHTCYKTTFLFTSKATLLVNGKQKEVFLSRFYRAWLAPDLNMLPIRLERLRQNDHKTRTIMNEDAEVEVIREQSDFREVAPGIWFPFSSSQVHIFTNRPAPFVFMVNTKEVNVNENAIVPARVRFPKGTQVTDYIENVKYTVGLTGEHLLDEIALTTEKIKDLQEGHIKLEEQDNTSLNKAIHEKTTPTENILNKDKHRENRNILNKDKHRENRMMYDGRRSVLLFASVIGSSFFVIGLAIFILHKRIKTNT